MAGEKQLDLSIGWNGACKLGHWIPIRATLPADLPQLADSSFEVVAITFDPLGDAIEFPLSQKETDKRIFEGLIQIGKINSPIKVIVRRKKSDDQKTPSADEVLSREVALGETLGGGGGNKEEQSFQFRHLKLGTELILTIGDVPGFDEIYQTKKNSGKQTQLGSLRQRVVVPVDFENWQNDFRALESVDAIVVSGDYQFSTAINESIQKWVLQGGTLLITVGKEFDQYQSSNLSKWVPISVSKGENLYDLLGVEGLLFNAEEIRNARSFECVNAKLNLEKF